MFNAYMVGEKALKVNLANPRPVRGVASPTLES
jgi:hypothetical protein